MGAQEISVKHIAFLRGINVGGHHKVPMAALKAALGQLKFKNIVTLLNSGNVIFDSGTKNPDDLEPLISEKLEDTFGFPIPTIVRSAEAIQKLFNAQPFKGIEVHKDIRLYISFLKFESQSDLVIPWQSDDKSFQVIQKEDKVILSILDLSINQTPKAMAMLEKTYGKDITTRNWKTIARIVAKL